MPEIISATVGAGVVAYLAKDGVAKLLGPTADYLGVELKAFAQRRIEAVGRIFENATKKVGEEIDSAGQVPPKVLYRIINEGSFADDELAVEYFGGILASARSPEGRDDRGAQMATLVDSLSIYQRRAHYLLYATAANVFRGEGKTLALGDREKLQIFIPYSSFREGMDFSEEEAKNVSALLSHIFHGLEKHGLLGGFWQYGSISHLATYAQSPPSEGILFVPSMMGADLLLYAFGCGGVFQDGIFDPARDFSVDGMPYGIEGAKFLPVA